jgi:hypothetical protein
MVFEILERMYFHDARRAIFINVKCTRSVHSAGAARLLRILQLAQAAFWPSGEILSHCNLADLPLQNQYG